MIGSLWLCAPIQLLDLLRTATLAAIDHNTAFPLADESKGLGIC
jgi:hypothetical protein